MSDYIFIEKMPGGLYQIRTLIEGEEHVSDYDKALDLQTAMFYAKLAQERLLKDGIELPDRNIVVCLEAIRQNAAADLGSFKAYQNLKRSGIPWKQSKCRT